MTGNDLRATGANPCVRANMHRANNMVTDWKEFIFTKLGLIYYVKLQLDDFLCESVVLTLITWVVDEELKLLQVMDGVCNAARSLFA